MSRCVLVVQPLGRMFLASNLLKTSSGFRSPILGGDEPEGIAAILLARSASLAMPNRCAVVDRPFHASNYNSAPRYADLFFAANPAAFRRIFLRGTSLSLNSEPNPEILARTGQLVIVAFGDGAVLRIPSP